MSSFLGHTLAAITIHSIAKPYNSKPHLRVWLGWLVLIACAPDIDYIIPIFHPSSHQGMRITHSIFSSLLLPLFTIGILLLVGVRGQTLKTSSLQVILAGLSHPVMDLLVGVTPLPLLYPWNLQMFKLPFGILPSAGRIKLNNYLFYKNLFIEMGVIAPLFFFVFIKSKGYEVLEKQKIILMAMLFLSAYFMLWAFNLSR
ncbi:MAG TPA: hypothetical protein DEG17_03270 [Cyanobacteria bacterium UBA11149]|nr:hypothetical protein [Cyanobacteria bacterium UBA11367]HBE56505.1 hypothetical protein [Cyanobacteria bacterium UBA11366]HBK66970.1 hypothetical protein [Cyanobacteria bacterium UBA11166]HBR72241.1 hypothetical protein [Cyanobacteria bacterium UBA11159]HBW87927.1 hypothetical protein [Cyanobacteria bacterium UBA11149]